MYFRMQEIGLLKWVSVVWGVYDVRVNDFSVFSIWSTQHEADYLHILKAVKGSVNEKRLASQFISKFFSKFPKHSSTALDALLDLLEDDDVNIRKQAAKDLPTICKESPEFVSKIADILTQLLVAEDASELQIVTASLVTLYKLHPKGFLTGLFSQIETGEDLTREKAVSFLSNKLKFIPEESWTRELEEFLISEVKKAMGDCNRDEFVVFMNILSGLKVTKLVSGQQALLDIITEQSGLNSITALDSETLDKLLMCVKYAVPHFSPFVTSNQYVNFFCVNLLPNLEALASETPGVDLEILQYLAEMVPSVQPCNTATPIDLNTCLTNIFNRLLQQLPLPPTDAENTEEPTLQLTHVESLLYAFHQICKHNIDFLTTNEEKLKDFRLRLQYLARGVQSYMKKLKDSLTVKGKQVTAETEENKFKIIALKTTTNINTLIRDLFHSPPTFKSTVVLSWRPTSTSKSGGEKGVGVTKGKGITTSHANGSGDAKAPAPTTATPGNKRKPIEAPPSDPSGDSTEKKKKVFDSNTNKPSGKFSSRPGGELFYSDSLESSSFRETLTSELNAWLAWYFESSSIFIFADVKRNSFYLEGVSSSKWTFLIIPFSRLIVVHFVVLIQDFVVEEEDFEEDLEEEVEETTPKDTTNPCKTGISHIIVSQWDEHERLLQ